MSDYDFDAQECIEDDGIVVDQCPVSSSSSKKSKL